MPPKSRRRPVSTDKRFRKASTSGDHGTPERWQHSGFTYETTDRPGILAARATEENILDVLGLKKLLSPQQIEAGLKLKSDYHAAAIESRLSGSYSGVPSAKDFFRAEHDRTDKQEAAYRRWKNAVEELARPQATAVLTTVCHDEPPTPRDIPVLQEGLQKLAAWYGLSRQLTETKH